MSSRRNAFAVPSYAPTPITLEVTRDPRRSLLVADKAAHEPLDLYPHLYLIQVKEVPQTTGYNAQGVPLDAWGQHTRRASELIQGALGAAQKAKLHTIERVVGVWECRHTYEHYWSSGVMYRKQLDEDPRPELAQLPEWSTDLSANLSRKLTTMFDAGYLLVLPKSAAGAYQYPRQNWSEREDARLGGRGLRLAVGDWRELATTHTVELKQV